MNENEEPEELSPNFLPKPDQKKQEMDLFHKWKETNHPRYFQALYQSMKPLIYSAAKKASYGSNIPESAHRIYAAQNFLDALNTFKPTAGALLQTHVYGAVHQKAKRLNYMYQNLGHQPENRATRIGVFQAEQENLRGELGREPTPSELAARLDMGVRDVFRTQKEIHKDLAMSEGVEENAYFEGNPDEEKLDYLYYELTPEEQLVYDHVFGKHGRMRMVKRNNKIDFERIGAALGFSASKTRVIWARIKAKYEKAVKR